jgi:hypothetical protein
MSDKTNPKIWFAVDEDGSEAWYSNKPVRSMKNWEDYDWPRHNQYLFPGAIAVITGVTLSWQDEPLEWVVGERKEADRFDAEQWLGEKRDIWNHPMVSDRTNTNGYEVADLMADFANEYLQTKPTPAG